MAENPISETLGCDHLILLVGTNPLPNFVVADYFLQNNSKLQTIWLLYSEENNFQASTNRQAKKLETLLRKRWQGKHVSLKFPLEKISLTDVSDAATILREIENKMLRGWQANQSFHLNYTGGTKAMATHVYRRLQELQKRGQHPFSYLDANNFRLVVDNYGIERFVGEDGIETDDLRQKVQVEFEDLIALHDFVRKNHDSPANLEEAKQLFQQYIQPGKKADIKDGHWLETYLAQQIQEKLGSKLNNPDGVLQNWEIRKSTWRTYFELDIILLHGYHLTGLSSYKGSKKPEAKNKGFEIIQRCRQIGGDEARAIIVAGLEKPHTDLLQEELEYETGCDRKNVLALGLADLRNEESYLNKIEKFVFD
ncbi:hypothetical protein HUU05_24460 [candidate division KSB1 bacterium]|nr:hypothetical protein [candidate division KSB1 bacterium]